MIKEEIFSKALKVLFACKNEVSRTSVKECIFLNDICYLKYNQDCFGGSAMYDRQISFPASWLSYSKDEIVELSKNTRLWNDVEDNAEYCEKMKKMFGN